MSDNPVASASEPKHLLIASYPDENRAAQVLAQLKEAKSAAGLGIEETAIVRKEDDGKLSIKEQNDVGVGTSAAAGGLIGGLLGGLLGRGTSGAIIGGLLGAGAAKVIDAGIPDDRLKAIGAGLPLGSSVVAAIVPDSVLPAARTLLEGTGAAITVEPIAGGASVNMPKTGVGQIDALAEQLGEAVKPFAGTAATSLSGAATSTEDFARQAGDQLNDAWKGVTGGSSEKPA